MHFEPTEFRIAIGARGLAVHYGSESAAACCGARDSKGSLRALASEMAQNAPTIRGSVMIDTILIPAPQEHNSGSISKIFLNG